MHTRSRKRKQTLTSAPSSAPSSPQRLHPVLDDFAAEKLQKSQSHEDLPTKRAKRESSAKSPAKNQKENVENTASAEQRSPEPKRIGHRRKQILKDNEATVAEKATAKREKKRSKGATQKSSKKGRVNKSSEDPDDVEAVDYKDLFSKLKCYESRRHFGTLFCYNLIR